MTEDQILLRATCFEFMQKHAEQFTHAVTLTLKPYRMVASEYGDLRQVLTPIEASANFRHFLKRLNAETYGNATKRFGKSVTAMPLLEGHATHKLLHYHCALGNFPVDLCEKGITAKITSAWHQTAFGNAQIDIQPMRTSGWLNYAGKEIGFRNADVIDWENVRLSAASLT